MRHRFCSILFAAAVAAFLIACDDNKAMPTAVPAAIPAPTPTATPTPTPVAAAQPTIVGQVLDPDGKPVERATIWADNMLLYNSNLEIRTDAEGRYRLPLPDFATTWRVTGTVSREYHGHTYRFDLHPADDAPVVGHEGGTRDFTWRLAGPKPDDMGEYGSKVIVFPPIGVYDLEPERLELTLTPDGPLVDGSTGSVISRTLVRTADGDAIADVPVGRYRITARFLPESGEPEPLQLAVHNSENYADEVVADFDAPFGWTLNIYQIRLDVRRKSE